MKSTNSKKTHYNDCNNNHTSREKSSRNTYGYVLCYYKASELWERFMTRRTEIQDRVGTDYFSIQVFTVSYRNHFNLTITYQKWAAVTVPNFGVIPAGMQSLIIPAGLYAVIIYKGDKTGAPTFFQAIFTSWLPNSIYKLANHPHFEILRHKYKKMTSTQKRKFGYRYN